MELQFIAISLVVLLLTPGSMLSVYDSPASVPRMAQLPAAQAFPTPETELCIRFEQETRLTSC